LIFFQASAAFSLGLERAGMTTVAFCEIDPFCRRVLAKHWPGVPIYDDVRDVDAARLGADGIAVDVICGGFPCQDISVAGKGAGLAGERSGLWREYARVIGELRPRYVVVENVAALLGRGLGDVLADLAALGYDAEWHCIPASAVGAPHERDRVWIVAYPNDGQRDESELAVRARRDAVGGSGEVVAYPDRQPAERRKHPRSAERREATSPEGSVVARDASGGGTRLREPHVADADCAGREERDAAAVPSISRFLAGGIAARGREWPIEPGVGRVVDGVPRGVDRLRALGNAVVPQIPELIGRAILQAEAA
jgi:DNA (cytosine-5)-methyltransferase 1